MITYYLIGNWMGSFRTKSVIETCDEFMAWAEKYNAKPDESKIWKMDDGGRVVFESIDNESMKKLNNPHIGL